MFADSSLIRRYGLKQRANLILLVTNVVCALIYVRQASFGWAFPDEPVTAEPFIWAMAILPVITIALLINVAWGVIILWRRRWSSGRLWLFVVMIWLIAIGVDFAHH